ncbi:hypothetical protein NL676_013148 [Syzygium grande]|nr:hypothetical protein NL676_013148 [Syzygium grande]
MKTSTGVLGIAGARNRNDAWINPAANPVDLVIISHHGANQKMGGCLEARPACPHAIPALIGRTIIIPKLLGDFDNWIFGCAWGEDGAGSKIILSGAFGCNYSPVGEQENGPASFSELDEFNEAARGKASERKYPPPTKSRFVRNEFAGRSQSKIPRIGLY